MENLIIQHGAVRASIIYLHANVTAESARHRTSGVFSYVTVRAATKRPYARPIRPECGHFPSRLTLQKSPQAWTCRETRSCKHFGVDIASMPLGLNHLPVKTYNRMVRNLST